MKGQQTSLELLANLFSLEGEEDGEGEDWGEMDSEEEDIGDEEVLNGEEGNYSTWNTYLLNGTDDNLIIHMTD